MLGAFWGGLAQVFLPQTFVLMLVGIGLGFVVGILPGLGGGGALALMLPFTFKMGAFEAFAFLLGMAAVLGTTGDITSILFGIPGEAHTAATVVDGHPMAMRPVAPWAPPSPAYLGAFAEKNVFADLVVMLVFGALGWVMERADWPKAPLILGLVLGPLVENNLFLAVSSDGA